MRQPKGFQEYGKEGCCPHEFDHVPNITGNFETDASIMRSKNKDAQARLKDHISGDVYEINTAYHHTTQD
jgi:hypothetical protein